MRASLIRISGAISISFVGDLPDSQRQAQLISRARRIATRAFGRLPAKESEKGIS
jgi:hypothetical protein